ncbi:MAG: alpha/beta fold hydrolase [Blastocatellales bacterium]|nr:alpha/beta hydrolase [Nitrosomonas nitrosa]
MNTLYWLLSYSWSGLLIAAVVGLIGWLITRFKRRRFVRWLGYAVCTLAAVMAIASGVATYRISRALNAHPPMGKLVDVGGYRLHILAEGDAKGGPTLVWISGGHGSGLAMHHLHKRLRGETRSILFDRPGTGWSDTGPFPSSTKREADELNSLLTNTGEKGPFILLGHSYGGLLAANYARRYPKNMAALVLLDPTPPDVMMYMPGGEGPNIAGNIARGSRMMGLMKLFGLYSDPQEPLANRDDEIGKLIRTINEQLADVRTAMNARDQSPAGSWVAASVFSEWLDPKLLAELVVYDGELGEMPVYLIAPEGDTKVADIKAMGVRDDEVPRAMNFLKHTRKRYLSISSRSEFIKAPDGTGHNYPYEAPGFVVEQVRNILAKSRTAVPTSQE